MNGFVQTSLSPSVGVPAVERGWWSVAEWPEAEVVLDTLPDPVEAAWLENEEEDDHESEDGVAHGRQLVGEEGEGVPETE